MTEIPEIVIQPAEDFGLWSIQANASLDLNDFSHSLFDQEIKFGEMITLESERLIQLWPKSAYLLSTQSALPNSASVFDSIITDISHGFCQINLRSTSALSFLNEYCSANIQQVNILRNQTLRTRLGQYSVLIWWDNSSDIHLLIERSYTQSFTGFLHSLADRI